MTTKYFLVSLLLCLWFPSEVLEIFPFVAVQGYEDEDKDGEGPEGGASVADKRKGDADDRHQADGHAYVDEQVHEYAAGDTVTVDAGECLPATLRVLDDPPDEQYI